MEPILESSPPLSIGHYADKALWVDDTLAKHLSQHWGLTTCSSNDWQELRRALADKISDLLENDHPQLMNAFYRLDVDSEKAEEIIKKAPINEIPLQLADLVLKRELEKVRTRQRYSQPPSSDDANSH